MKLNSFREILVRKTENNPNLRSFAKYAGDDYLAGLVIESLKKMARNTNAGKRANNAVRLFANSMDSHPDAEGELPKMIRGAIGHHVSHYKAHIGHATTGSDVEKKKHQAIADAHASQAFKIMHMADKVEKHAPVMENGKKSLSIDYVSPHSWERHVEGKYNKDPVSGEWKKGNDTKGLGYWKHSGVHGYDHLQKSPHKTADKETKRHGHTKAYPFEHTQINGKYIHVDDSVDTSGSTAAEPNLHSFDHHPIMQHFDESPKKRDENSDKKYVNEVEAYNDSPHPNNYYDNEEATEKADSKAYAARGEKVSNPVHTALTELKEEAAPSVKEKPVKQKTISEEEDIISKLIAMNPKKYGHLKGDKK